MSAPAARDERPLVAHVIHRLAVGGLENGVVNLVNHMPAERYRHAVVCLTDFTDFRSRIRRADVPVAALHKREGKDPACYLRLWRELRRLRPAIVHTRNLGTLDGVIPAWCAGRARRIHGEHGFEALDAAGMRPRYVRMRRALRPLIHAWVAMSKHLERWLWEGVGVEPERVVQIYNGVDSERFAPPESGRGPLPEPGFAPAGSLIVGSVGRMDPVKDLPTLARALAALTRRAPALAERVRWVHVGDGAARDEVRRIAEESGLGDRVLVTGLRDDVPQWLRAFDVFALPSLAEGISNTLLEAMASGVPAIASSVGGNPELVVEGETGALVPAGDADALAGALVAYLGDPGRRAAHGAAARRRAQTRFAIPRMVERYAGLYDRVLRGERPRPREREG